ncbi:hypothetical protein IJG14_05210 [bacterium]|nr:hypothetical protein [bacterium]
MLISKQTLGVIITIAAIALQFLSNLKYKNLKQAIIYFLITIIPIFFITSILCLYMFKTHTLSSFYNNVLEGMSSKGNAYGLIFHHFKVLADINLIWVIYLSACVFIFILSATKNINKNFNFHKNKFDNFLAVSLSIFFSLLIILIAYKSVNNFITSSDADSQKEKIQISPQYSDKPDIYFIILDAYINTKAAKKHYNYDNSKFISIPLPIDREDFLSSTTRTPNAKANFEQIEFLNNKVLKSFDKILDKNKNSVIVLISDHGYLPNKKHKKGAGYPIEYDKDYYVRAGNLTAVYFPDKNYSEMYQTISLVNLIRVVLNKYFEAKLPLLPDKHFYSPSWAVYEPKEVTDEVQKALSE